MKREVLSIDKTYNLSFLEGSYILPKEEVLNRKNSRVPEEILVDLEKVLKDLEKAGDIKIKYFLLSKKKGVKTYCFTSENAGENQFKKYELNKKLLDLHTQLSSTNWERANRDEEYEILRDEYEHIKLKINNYKINKKWN